MCPLDIYHQILARTTRPLCPPNTTTTTTTRTLYIKRILLRNSRHPQYSSLSPHKHPTPTPPTCTFASRTHRAHHHRHCCSSKYKFMYTLALGYYVLHLNIFLWKYISVLCIYYYCTLSPECWAWCGSTPAHRRPSHRERLALYVLLIRPDDHPTYVQHTHSLRGRECLYMTTPVL